MRGSGGGLPPHLPVQRMVPDASFSHSSTRSSRLRCACRCLQAVARRGASRVRITIQLLLHAHGKRLGRMWRHAHGRGHGPSAAGSAWTARLLRPRPGAVRPRFELLAPALTILCSAEQRRGGGRDGGGPVDTSGTVPRTHTQVRLSVVLTALRAPSCLVFCKHRLPCRPAHPPTPPHPSPGPAAAAPETAAAARVALPLGAPTAGRPAAPPLPQKPPPACSTDGDAVLKRGGQARPVAQL